MAGIKRPCIGCSSATAAAQTRALAGEVGITTDRIPGQIQDWLTLARRCIADASQIHRFIKEGRKTEERDQAAANLGAAAEAISRAQDLLRTLWDLLSGGPGGEIAAVTSDEPASVEADGRSRARRG